ncbi:MAG: nucleoid-associated protein [Candidatus Saccharibacteria bacterium]|nr:nucleoid-associated protein [Candidatus Saccharibacteria bacterium]
MNLTPSSKPLAVSTANNITPLTVLNAVTADLFRDRESNSPFYAARIGENWDLNSTTANEFVSVIERKFAKNNKYHGFFDPNSYHMAPRTLSKFVEDSISFDDMVKAFVKNACAEANEVGRGTLTLGHLVMVHYKTVDDDEDVGRFLAVLVGDQSGFEFDKNLQPADLKSINTNELRHAAMFDLTLFKEIYPANDGDAYLKFIAGKSKSAFLQDAFGCGDYIPNKYSVEQVNAAVLDFLDDPIIPPERRLTILKEVTSHLESAAKRQVSVSIIQIQQVINKFLPVGSEKIDGFNEFVNLGAYTISERFQPTRQSAAMLSHVEISDPNGDFKCSVSIEAIGFGGDEGKIIKVDDEMESITLPLTLKAKAVIRQILGDRDQRKD